MVSLDHFLQKITAHPIRVFGVILSFCLVGYFRVLSYPFMMDDYIVLWGEDGVENRTFAALFTDFQGGDFYRPVGHVLIWICHRLFGENYTAYHTVNLLLLAVAAVLFFLIVQALFNNKLLALLTAILYATHPINNMLVNYITVTVITTYIMMMQLCTLFFIKGVDTQDRRFYNYSLIFFILALFSHEMAIWCPFYLFAIVYFARRYTLKDCLRQVWPSLAITAAFLIFRKFLFSFGDVLSVVGAVMTTQFPVYITSLADLVIWYLSKLTVPIDYIFLWNQPMGFDLLLTRTCQIFGVVIVLIYLIFKRWQKGPLAFGVFFFMCGFLPIGVASYVYWPWNEPFIEPHWFYFSSMGFYLIVAYGIVKLKEKLKLVLWAGFLASLFIYNFGLLQLNNYFWRDQKTYCQYWIALDPYNMTPFYWYGRSSMNEGDYRTAISYFADGLKVTSVGNQYLLADLGYAHFMLGDEETAMELFKKNIKQWPYYSRTYFYLALFHLKHADLERASVSISKAVRLYPASKLYQRYAAEISKQLPQNQ